MDPRIPPRHLDHTNNHSSTPHLPPKSEPKKTTYNYLDEHGDEVVHFAGPLLHRSPTKIVPREAIPKSESKHRGILEEDLPLILSQVAIKKEDSSFELKRTAPRSPDCMSGPEAIHASIEGSLISFDTSPKKVRSLKGYITFRKELGEGVFGQVRLGSLSGPALAPAHSTEKKENSPTKTREKNVAVKTFTPINKDARLDREVAIVKMIMSNPPKNIPRIYGLMRVGDKDNHLIMKYCNKKNISNFFDENATDKILCYKTFLELISIVENYHNAGFCHRDIWEDNFLRHEKKKSRETIILLTDFGHAERLSKNGDSPIGPDHEHSMAKIPLQFRNCPRYLSKAWAEAAKTKDFSKYQEILDAKGFEIDRFQFGMMLFRIATAKDTHIAAAFENRKQIDLVKFLEQQFQHPESNHPLLPKNVDEYLKMHFHTLPEPVRKVISGLLNTTHQMELPEARKILSDYLNRFH